MGVDLRWPDGSPAGQTFHPHRLDRGPERGTGDHCFVPQFGCSAAEALRVCVAAELLEQGPAPTHQ